MTSANRTFIVYYSLRSACSASIHRMIYGAVSDFTVFHCFYYFQYYSQILSCFSVQFHICNVSSARQLMKRCLFLNFFKYTHLISHINMKRIYIIIPVRYIFDFSKFFFINSQESSRQTFRRSCQNRIIQFICFSQLFGYFIHHFHCIIKSVVS